MNVPNGLLHPANLLFRIECWYLIHIRCYSEKNVVLVNIQTQRTALELLIRINANIVCTNLSLVALLLILTSSLSAVPINQELMLNALPLEAVEDNFNHQPFSINALTL